MKFRLGIRGWGITLFVALFITGVLFLNHFFINQSAKINQSLHNMKIDESLHDLNFQYKSDEETARKLMKDYRNTIAYINIIQRDNKIYSVVFIFILFTISIIIFWIIFTIITKPLEELHFATMKISEGDFSIKLSENGIMEIKELKMSFNKMSNELEQAQQKLIVAEKEMIWKDMARILAHEIKNPLTPIQLSFQRMEEAFYDDPAKLEQIFPEASSIINQEINNLENLAKSFSEFAKMATPNMEIFDPADEVEKIVNSYKDIANIETDIKRGLKINFDKQHFYHIVTNIVKNAVEVSNFEKAVKIRLYLSNRFVVFSVKDEGPGISSGDMKKIFEPYFTKKKSGTGLGLAIVKRLVDNNHAMIRVKSRVNEGSEFILLIEEYNENSYNG